MMQSKEMKGNRFVFIDNFRGLIMILMLVDHSSYYLNSIWKNLDDFDPLFPNLAQYLLRYSAYICAPGFLMIAGAMVWYSYNNKIKKGYSSLTVKWKLIQRGLFLVFLQMTWVNSSWSGFQSFRPWHFGIISSIGISIIIFTLIVQLSYRWRLLLGLAILLIHPFLLNIPYEIDNSWKMYFMQTFVDAGSFNKYPVIPWFGLAIIGSVLATGWLEIWKTDTRRVGMSVILALIAFVLAFGIRTINGFGNTFPYSDVGSLSFFMDQKYPPSLFMNLWFIGMVALFIAIIIKLGNLFPKIMPVLYIPGRVPLFFYGMHIAILGVFVKRFDFLYREGGVTASLIGVFVVMLVMIPLCIWFYKFKQKSNNYLIQMI